MVRFLFTGILTAVASYFALQIMPWWIPMLIGFLLVLIFPMRKGAAFLSTGLGAALLYVLLCILTDNANEHILSSRMAQLFHLPAYWMMTAVTALIGFITAGLGGWVAASLIALFRKRSLTENTFVREQNTA